MVFYGLFHLMRIGGRRRRNTNLNRSRKMLACGYGVTEITPLLCLFIVHISIVSFFSLSSFLLLFLACTCWERGGGGGGHVRKCPTFVPSIDNTSCSDFKSTRLSTETCVRGGR